MLAVCKAQFLAEPVIPPNNSEEESHTCFSVPVTIGLPGDLIRAHLFTRTRTTKAITSKKKN